jgi:predicted glycosyltransferase
MRVMIVVTHLLGTGHLRRAMTLARAYADAGHAATVVSGGTAVTGLRQDDVTLIQLPALKSDGTDFSRLLKPDGGLADAAYLSGRKATLLAALESTAPDILITELFPFGRRVLRDEFLALLEAARPHKALILCSIRDILAPPSKPAKADAAHDLIARYFDGVLVHSDPAVTPLATSWPVTPALEPKLHYTGFVAPPAPLPHPRLDGTDEILVSTGGGAVGAPVFRAAKAAAGLIPTHTWRLLVGGTNPGALLEDLQQDAPSNLIAEPARADFAQMLHHAACSISMAGYNTVMDLLQTGVPAVLVPFDDGAEVEQGLRASALAKLPGFTVLNSADLNAETLANTVSHMLATPRRTSDVGLNGAAETVRISVALLEAAR